MLRVMVEHRPRARSDGSPGGRTGDLLRRVQLPAAISNGAPFAAQLSNGVLRVCVSR